MSKVEFRLWGVAFLVLWLAALSGCRAVLDDFDVSQPPPAEEPVAVGDTAGDAGVGGISPPDEAPTFELRCEPLGRLECEGRALQECIAVSGGTDWITRRVCESDALCNKEGGQCEPPVCDDRELRCAGPTLQSCAPGRQGWLPLVDCDTPAHCDNEVERGCRAVPCTVGERRCNAGVLEACNADATGWDPLVTCDTQALCQQTLASSAEGEEITACASPVCGVSEVRCVGSEFQRCNSGRTDWALAETCVSPELCLDVGVAQGCRPPECLPGEVRCSAAGSLEICSGGQDRFDEQLRCINAAHCDPVAGTCRDPGCDSGERRCNGRQIETCREDRTDFERAGDAPCATAALCINGGNNNVFCQPPACFPGQFRCQGAQLQTCNGGQTGFVNVGGPCETPELCDAPAQRCNQPVCRAGFHNCLGNILRRCLPGRHASENIADCSLAGGCNPETGQCGDPCIVGQPRCRDGVVQRCDNEFQGWRNVAFCASQELCEQGVASGGNCANPACLPNQLRCQGNRLERCNGGRTGFDVLADCNFGNRNICDAAGGQCDLCQPNQFRCQGGNLMRCSGDGQGESLVEACGSASLCQASGGDGRCLRCAPAGGFECRQSTLFQCSVDQRNQNQIDTCRDSGLCRADLGGCLACNPVGARRCDAGQVLECRSAPLNQEAVSESCDSVALCMDNGQGQAACQGAVCRPGDLFCDSSGAVLRCNDDLTGTVPTGVVCATAALCEAGSGGNCAQPVCDEGESRCTGGQVFVCNPGRTGFTVPGPLCGSAALCVNGPGNTASCREPACAADAIECSGSLLRRCRTDRSGFDVLADCGSTGLCLATLGRNPSATTCDECAGAQCENGQVSSCTGGQLGAPQACEFGCAADGPRCGPCRDELCAGGVCFQNSCVSCFESNGQVVGCAPGERCVDNARCVECQQDTDCVDGQVCSGQVCVECDGDADCQSGVCAGNQCVECEVAGDCAPTSCRQAPACTGSRCVLGAPAANGTACPGGLCVGGSCQVGANCVQDSDCSGGGECQTPVNCNGNNQCAGGVSRPDGFACDGGLCIGGTCQIGAQCLDAGDCDSAGVCQTAVTCSAARRCVGGETVGDGTPCPDGLCIGGACVQGAVCVDGGDCAGATECRGAESCGAGQCLAGAPVADGTPCTEGLCLGGNCQVGAECVSAADCEGLVGGDCLGAPSCNGGQCVAGNPIPDGTQCPDGLCAGGECQAGAQCVDASACTSGGPCRGPSVCNGFQCELGAPAQAGTPCDGGLCVAGECSQGAECLAAGDCDPPAECQLPAACTGQRCLFGPAPDGDPCGVDGTGSCQQGVCVAAAAEP